MTKNLPPETEEELQFVKKHRNLSSASSALFALAGATFIGVLGKLTNDLLTAAQKSGKLMDHMPKDKRYWGIVAGLAAFGAVCMFLSNWLESKKTVLEWRLGGDKISRKMQNANPDIPVQRTSTPPVMDTAPSLRTEEPSPQETTHWQNKRKDEKELAMAGASDRGRV